MCSCGVVAVKSSGSTANFSEMDWEQVDLITAGARFPNGPKHSLCHKSLFVVNKNLFQALKLGSYFASPHI